MSVRLPAALLVLAAVALTGCEKPPPYASVFTDGRTESGQASAWCFGSGSAAEIPLAADCTQGPRLAGAAKVTAGHAVAIDVPTSATKDGWAATLLTNTGNLTLVPGISGKKSYVRFTVPTGVSVNTYVLEVIALRSNRNVADARGVWRFRLDVQG
jgi:hypothetical protein